MLWVLAVMPDSEMRERMERALEGCAGCIFVNDSDAVLSEVQKRSTAAVFLAPRYDSGGSTAPLVTRLRREFPALPVYIYFGRSEPDDDEVVAFAHARPTDMIFRSFDEVELRVVASILAAPDESPTTATMRAIVPLVPRQLLPVFRECLDGASDRMPVEMLAARVGMHRRTLARQLAAAGLPPPSTLITWARIIGAAHTLASSGSTVEHVALEHGFGSASALRTTVARHTGLTLARARTSDGMSVLIARFVAQLSRQADPGGVYRSRPPSDKTVIRIVDAKRA